MLWVDSNDPMVSATGRFVLMYHLLWELTHVVFEHPGLLEEDHTDAVCVTCSDEGRLAEVVAPPAAATTAVVRTAAGEEQVDVCVAHLANPDRADQLATRLGERLAENLGGRELWCGELGAVLGAHVGPGMIAVCIAPRP